MRAPHALATVLLAGVVAVATQAGHAAATGPGCDPSHPAVAYHPGGVVLGVQPGSRPVPCAVSTGYPAAESHLVATRSGKVIYTPAVLPSGALGAGSGPAIDPDTQANAVPAALAVTADHGAHWSLVKPFGVTWNPTDHADYVDAATDRFFFEDYGPIPLAPQLGPDQEGPAHIMWTDDQAKWHHTAIPDLVLPENPKFTAAPAPAGEAKPIGYPNVVYFCANTNVGFTSPAILGRLCDRSLDGGSSWAEASMLFGSTVPQHPECGANGENFSAVDGYYPQPTHDGFLYVLVNCGSKTYLARSTDEGHTFPIIHTSAGPLEVAAPSDSITTAIGNGPQLRIDGNDNFYVVSPTTVGRTITRLSLRISTDRGHTWTPAFDVTPPGVARVLRWTVAQRGNVLAFALVGQRKGQTTWDAYLSETRNALDGTAMTLWSAVANHVPLMYADHIVGAGYIVGQGEVRVPYPFPLGIQPLAGVVSAGNDFLGETIAADGTTWGSFNQDCGPSPDAAGCQADGDQTRGLVASLGGPAG